MKKKQISQSLKSVIEDDDQQFLLKDATKQLQNTQQLNETSKLLEFDPQLQTPLIREMSIQLSMKIQSNRKQFQQKTLFEFYQYYFSIFPTHKKIYPEQYQDFSVASAISQLIENIPRFCSSFFNTLKKLHQQKKSDQHFTFINFLSLLDNQFIQNHKSEITILLRLCSMINQNIINRNEVVLSNDKYHSSLEILKGKLYIIKEVQIKIQQIVQLSALDHELSRGSSNCLFLLIWMRWHLQDINLSQIHIKDISLKNGNFSYCNLQGSVFNSVDISGCNFYYANLQNVNWQNLELGQTEFSIKFKGQSSQFLRQNFLIIEDFGENQKNYTIYSTKTGKKLNQFSLKINEFTSEKKFTNSSENEILLTSINHYVAVVCIKTGRMMRKFRLAEQIIKGYCIAASTDGKLLGYGNCIGTVKIWNIALGNITFQIEEHQNQIIQIFFQNSGNIMAYGCKNGLIRFLSTKYFSCIGQFKIDSIEPFTGIFFSAFDQKFVAISGLYSQQISKIYQFQSSQVIEILSEKNYTYYGHINEIAFSPNGFQLAIGFPDYIALINLKSEQQVTRFQKNTNPFVRKVGCLKFSLDSRFLLYSEVDTRLWNLEREEKINKFLNIFNFHKMAISKDIKIIATACSDLSIRLWDIITIKQMTVLQGHQCEINCLAFSQCNQILASADIIGHIVFWKMKDFTLFGTVDQQSCVESLVFSSESDILASGGKEEIILWNAQLCIKIFTLKCKDSQVKCLAFVPDAKLIISCSNLENPKILRDLEEKLQRLEKKYQKMESIVISSDESLLAFHCNGYDVVLMQLKDFQLIPLPYQVKKKSNQQELISYSILFSADGSTLAASFENYIKLWDIFSRTFIGELTLNILLPCDIIAMPSQSLIIIMQKKFIYQLHLDYNRKNNKLKLLGVTIDQFPKYFSSFHSQTQGSIFKNTEGMDITSLFNSIEISRQFNRRLQCEIEREESLNQRVMLWIQAAVIIIIIIIQLYQYFNDQ